MNPEDLFPHNIVLGVILRRFYATVETSHVPVWAPALSRGVYRDRIKDMFFEQHIFLSDYCW